MQRRRPRVEVSGNAKDLRARHPLDETRRLKARANPSLARAFNHLRGGLRAGPSRSASGPAPTVTAIDDGDYQIDFPGAGTPYGHAYAFGMAAPPMYCNIHSWTVWFGAQRLHVRCYQVGNGDLNPMMLINVGFFS